MKEKDELLSRVQAAKYLGIQPETLKTWACLHRYDLTYIKVGRCVKYRFEDLKDFLTRNTIRKVNQ